jgi:mannitol/fructose-specific phosphotransferase system IIA component
MIMIQFMQDTLVECGVVMAMGINQVVEPEQEKMVLLVLLVVMPRVMEIHRAQMQAEVLVVMEYK